MRILGLDHLRGFGIILVIVFSLWQWMYYPVPEFSLLVHNQNGQFRFGDLIFPLFLFCSGVSAWLLCSKLRQSGRTIAEAEKKYLLLILTALVISAAHLFTPFPDEVMMIAVCNVILFNLLWSNVSRKSLIAASILLPLMLFAFKSLSPDIWKMVGDFYLGGWLGLLYYLPIVIIGSVIAQDTLPGGKFEPKTAFKAIEKWLAIFLAAAIISALIFPIDKMGISPSFLPVAMLACASLFWLFLNICDQMGFNSGFLRLIGAHSLWGWALLFFVSGGIFAQKKMGDFDPSIYLPFCALLLLLLYAALWIREKTRNKK